MENFEQYLAPLLAYFDGEPWPQGIAIMCATFLFASIISWFIFRILKFLTSKTKSFLDDRLLAIARPPIYYSLLMTGFSAGVNRMPLTDKLTDYLIFGFKTLGVIIWMIALVRVSKIILQQLAWGAGNNNVRLIQPQTLPLFDNVSKLLIVAVAVYIIFQIWGVDMTAWLASAGIVGIAVGFAAKDTLANLFSGVFILADTPYKIGDYIVLDGNQRGKVTHIGLRSTRLITRGDVEVTVPNSIMGNSKVTNQSGGPHPKFRIEVKVGVAYGTDIDQVDDILMRIAENEPLVTKSPEPRVRFRTFGASSLDFELLCWIENPELRGRTLHKLNSAVYKRFNEENIEIPYAKQDLYIKELPHQ
ncbi:mechanosensitive ion channel family protein [uncultured Cocleimonas sp.]|uniref:mechanosensitive ion channel family protein n=1 Tax=uncultured Cocleimonas sp. TaxID=1051587 RepID=UPI002624A5A6|nr:mechanosensitive ion channel family protein [uncultured Cocleimonas sp.]